MHELLACTQDINKRFQAIRQLSNRLGPDYPYYSFIYPMDNNNYNKYEYILRPIYVSNAVNYNIVSEHPKSRPQECAYDFFEYCYDNNIPKYLTESWYRYLQYRFNIETHTYVFNNRSNFVNLSSLINSNNPTIPELKGTIQEQSYEERKASRSNIINNILTEFRNDGHLTIVTHRINPSKASSNPNITSTISPYNSSVSRSEL